MTTEPHLAIPIRCGFGSMPTFQGVLELTLAQGGLAWSLEGIYWKHTGPRHKESKGSFQASGGPASIGGCCAAALQALEEDIAEREQEGRS